MKSVSSPTCFLAPYCDGHMSSPQFLLIFDVLSVASFFTSSSSKTRRSALLTSLLAQMPIPTTSNESVMLLLRANSASEASSALTHRLRDSSSASMFDVDQVSVQSVTVDDGVWNHTTVSSNGPLFVQPQAETSSIYKVKNEGPLYGK